MPTVDDTTTNVLVAARDLANFWRNSPGGWVRLRAEARALVEAVIEYERAEVTR